MKYRSFCYATLAFMMALNMPAEAQFLERQVLAVAGGEFAAGEIPLSWTLGEPAVATLVAPPLLVTQGYQQGEPAAPPTSSRRFAQVPIALRVFPNPTQAVLQLRWEGASEGVLLVELIDQHGRVLRRQTWNGAPPGGAAEMDLSALPGGVYLLRAWDARHTFAPGIYQIVKVD
jgi:hypothetical protein